MLRSGCVLALSLLVTVSAPAAAQDSLEFTLDEVDAAEANAKAKGKAKGKAPPAPAIDVHRVLQDALGGVRWGMSKSDLLKLLKAQIRAEFEKRIKVERDIMRQDALYQEANQHYRRATENYVTFDGQKSGWDVSPVGSEFTHGNRESMLVVTNKNTRDIYFFIQGKLWKWYRELTPAAVDAADADEALAIISDPLGNGKPQQERRNDSNHAYEGQTWTDGTTRATALRRGGEVCFILEEVRTLDQLAALRPNRVKAGASGKGRAAAAIEAILLSGAELEARQ